VKTIKRLWRKLRAPWVEHRRMIGDVATAGVALTDLVEGLNDEIERLKDRVDRMNRNRVADNAQFARDIEVWRERALAAERELQA
jgi:hypothetical protein